LDAYDPGGVKTRWMKTSEIGRYWMARQLSDITVTPQGDGGWQITIHTNFPTPTFTLAVATQTNHVQVNGQALHEVSTVAALTSGTYLAQAKETVLAFDLAQGTTTIIIA
jgi:hypothetical protein